MKKVKFHILILMIIIMSSMTLTGCAKKTQSLAYIHEPSEEVISFYDNGTCKYKGTKYSYTMDDSYIHLTAGNGAKLDLRYVRNGDERILYEKSAYTCAGTQIEGSVVGDWKQDNGWEYIFTEDGMFSEDNIFYGYYTVDTVNHVIKLMYADPLEDAYLYYEFDGDKLIIDYPWPVVDTQKG